MIGVTLGAHSGGAVLTSGNSYCPEDFPPAAFAYSFSRSIVEASRNLPCAPSFQSLIRKNS